MKICDLHGILFEDGIEKIIMDLNDCILNHESEIQIIHGYHGHSYKDYIQSQAFIRDMEQEGFILIKKGIHSKGGVTEFCIDNIPEAETIRNPKTPEKKDTVPNPMLSKKKMTFEELKTYFEAKNDTI